MSDKKMDTLQDHDAQEAGAENTRAREVPQGKNRREVLQKILIGGGIAAGAAMLPDKWTRPVVDAIVVPAHAQLSTTSPPAPSARRFKEDIEDMGDASSGLMKLRPVTFRYKPEYAQGLRTLQYGLIAEEVAEVYPELVQYDPETGQARAVYHHLVNAMLLNEVQKQQKKIDALEGQVKELSALVARTISDRLPDRGLIQRDQFSQPEVQ